MNPRVLPASCRQRNLREALPTRRRQHLVGGTVRVLRRSRPQCTTSKSLLIFEVDQTLLRRLKDNFEAQGCRVRTAADGQKGLDSLLANPPDLVLLDIMLPMVHGYEICRTARAKQLDMPMLKFAEQMT